MTPTCDGDELVTVTMPSEALFHEALAMLLGDDEESDALDCTIGVRRDHLRDRRDALRALGATFSDESAEAIETDPDADAPGKA